MGVSLAHCRLTRTRTPSDVHVRALLQGTHWGGMPLRSATYMYLQPVSLWVPSRAPPDSPSPPGSGSGEVCNIAPSGCAITCLHHEPSGRLSRRQGRPPPVVTGEGWGRSPAIWGGVSGEGSQPGEGQVWLEIVPAPSGRGRLPQADRSTPCSGYRGGRGGSSKGQRSYD